MPEPSVEPRPVLVDLARGFGGAEVRVIQAAGAFGPGGCRIVCLKDSPLAMRLKEAGFQPDEFAGSKSSPRLRSYLSRIFTEYGANVLDAHNVQSYFWSALARGQNLAAVATVHSSTRMEHPGKLKGWLYENLERRTLPRFDQIITVSQALCEELAGFGIPASRIAKVPNGLPAARLADREREAARRELRAELGIPTAAPLIGSAGRLEPAKGFDLLLEAVSRLRANHPDLYCLIAGSGSQDSRLRTDARRLGLDGSLFLTGFRTDIPRLLAGIDVFVLPSRTEGIPYALLEAGSAGLPIAAARVGGVPEVLDGGRAGLLVEPGQPGALANAIERLLSDPVLAAELGTHAAAFCAANFTLERMIEGTCQAYRAAIERRNARRPG